MAKTTKNPFTIINRNREVNVRRAEFESDLKQSLKRSSPKTAELFERLPRALKEATLSSTAPQVPLSKWIRSPRKVIPEQSKIVSEFAAAVKVAARLTHANTVGLLDLGARVSGMPRLIERMNAAQDRLVFLEVQTPVPAGMVKTGSMLVAEFEHELGYSLEDSDVSDLGRNMLVNEFLTFAESVRVVNGLDALVGITPAMLAFREGRNSFWNYFSYGVDCLSVISTYDLRRFASSAGRPFEAAVGMLVVGQIVSTRNDIHFHRESRGCPLDFNEDREGLVESIRTMRFDDKCLETLDARDVAEAEAARSLVAALRRMKEILK
ncbi:hypothetical protein [Burkholderia cepacia]|uniref:hypothetical protein n=1 Tax=Burkholderia cepacia TaxID=292 RepID=UPI002FE1018C